MWKLYWGWVFVHAFGDVFACTRQFQGALVKTSSQEQYGFHIPNAYLHWCQLCCALAVLHMVITCSKPPLHHRNITCYKQEYWISGIKSKCETRSCWWRLSWFISCTWCKNINMLGKTTNEVIFFFLHLRWFSKGCFVYNFFFSLGLDLPNIYACWTATYLDDCSGKITIGSSIFWESSLLCTSEFRSKALWCKKDHLIS